MFAIAFFGLALAGSLLAQERERHCPDQVVQRMETRVTPLMPQTCGTNVNASFAGIQVKTPVNECPLVVVIRPGYDATVSSPGSGTYTIPVKTIPVTILQFECKGSWLLGILPIEVSSHCTETKSGVAGAVTHYEQLPCDIDSDPPSELDRESPRQVISNRLRRQTS